MNAPQQEQPDESFLDTIVGVFANPVHTLSGVVRRRPIANAFIVLIVLSIAAGLVQAVSIDPDDLDDAEELAVWIQGITILVAPAFGIGFIALITGVLWITSRILGGRGEYSAMFAGVGFAAAPSILQPIVGFLTIPLGDGAQGLIEFLVGLGVFVWMIILGVIVVRESNQFSTGRATAAVLMPFAPIAFLVIVGVVRSIAVGNVGY